MSENAEKLLQTIESIQKDKQSEAVTVSTAFLAGVKAGISISGNDKEETKK